MPRGLDMLIIGGLLAVLAAVPWSFRQRISEQFASSYIATVDLRTTTERDDKRVSRAFAAAQAAVRAEATIANVPSDLKLIRKSSLRVRGATRDAALATARSFSAATASAFDAEGSGRLDTYVSAYVAPVAGETSNAVLWAIEAGAAIIGIAALGFLVTGWRRGRAEQPEARVMQLPGTLALIVLAVCILPLLMPRWIFMALFAMLIPCGIAARIVHNAHEAKQGGQSSAVITKMYVAAALVVVVGLAIVVALSQVTSIIQYFSAS
jgi:hypothetical protein